MITEFLARTEHGPDITTLLPPGVAQGAVSRQEFVNLMVVEYTDRVTADLIPLDAAIEAENVKLRASLLSLYRSYHTHLFTQVEDITRPWRDGLALFTKVEAFGSDDLPADVGAYDGQRLNNHESYRESARRNGGGNTDARITSVDLVNERTWPVPTTKAERIAKVLAARRLAVDVWVTVEAATPGFTAYHTATVRIDPNPPPGWDDALQAHREACAACGSLKDQAYNLRNQIQDPALLGRRALALLTRTALEGHELPRLG
jgi:hypothetical protein